MSEEQKLFWKIYEEFSSTKYILENTENIIDEYLTKTNRNIIDIGCGQSSYILDFHNKKNIIYLLVIMMNIKLTP
ncbi:hypothetical protein N9D29_03725 [Flavobacteriaceae bacterium]|nr:hypothetical protein [Flavobacteriaceae bacterium]